jgi:hypothetical protein
MTWAKVSYPRKGGGETPRIAGSLSQDSCCIFMVILAIPMVLYQRPMSLILQSLLQCYYTYFYTSLSFFLSPHTNLRYT